MAQYHRAYTGTARAASRSNGGMLDQVKGRLAKMTPMKAANSKCCQRAATGTKKGVKDTCRRYIPVEVHRQYSIAMGAVDLGVPPVMPRIQYGALRSSVDQYHYRDTFVLLQDNVGGLSTGSCDSIVEGRWEE